MPDWDEDSPQQRENLTLVLREISQAAQRREIPTLEVARRWQTTVMRGLESPYAQFAGTFRGQSGLENVQVRVGDYFGVDSASVAEELARFAAKIQKLLSELDAILPPAQEPDTDQLAAIVDLCAWVHAEWVRIHPFANGNGRMARLWANCVALRYGLPPFIHLRPRPNEGYSEADAQAMQGDWEPTAAVFWRLLELFVRETEPHVTALPRDALSRDDLS